MNDRSRHPELILVGPLPPPYCGQAVMFKALVEELERRRIRFRVVNLAGCGKDRGGKATLWRMVEYVFILFDFIRKAVGRRKVVYITIAQSLIGFWRDLFMIWFSSLLGHRIICHLKGGNYDNFYRQQPKWIRWLIRMTLLRAHSLLVLGERLRRMYDFEPRLQSKLQVVPNGLPFEIQSDLSFKQLPAQGGEPVRILFLSNLIESKGYFDVLESVRILVREFGVPVQCHFCGEFLTNAADDRRVKNTDQAREMVQEFVRANDLSASVVLQGVVTGEEKLRLLEQAHFFVLPTSYNNEGQPVSIIEAIAFATVVVATDYRAIPDMVVDGVTGVLVPYGEARIMAEKIRDLVSDPARYAGMSRAARQHFLSGFTRESHLNRLIGVLDQEDVSTNTDLVLVGPLPPPHSGQALMFKTLVDELERRRARFRVVNLAGCGKDRGGRATAWRINEYFVILLKFVCKAAGFHKTVYITIAQSRIGFWRDFLMIWFSWCMRHRIVCHLHGGNYDNFYRQQPAWMQGLVRATLLRSHALLVLGDRLKQMYDFEPRLRPKLQVVPNGLPFEIPGSVPAKQLPANGEKPIQIMFLSNLIESKGYSDVLEAVRILVREFGMSAQCHFCGEFLMNAADDGYGKTAKNVRETFDQFVQSNGLSKSVFFHGVVTGDKKLRLLEQAHFFVLPTRYNNEGQPISIIEAIAYATVVLATNYRAIPDTVHDGVTGVLVPFGQPRVIAEKIRDLAADPARYAAMSLAARQLFLSGFTRESHLNRLIESLNQPIT